MDSATAQRLLEEGQFPFAMCPTCRLLSPCQPLRVARIAMVCAVCQTVIPTQSVEWLDSATVSDRTDWVVAEDVLGARPTPN